MDNLGNCMVVHMTLDVEQDGKLLWVLGDILGLVHGMEQDDMEQGGRELNDEELGVVEWVDYLQQMQILNKLPIPLHLLRQSWLICNNFQKIVFMTIQLL